MIVMVVVPGDAIAHVDGDAFPGVHVPAVDAYDTVAFASLFVAVTTIDVVPTDATVVYDFVTLKNAGVRSPGCMSRSISAASLDSYAPRS